MGNRGAGSGEKCLVHGTATRRSPDIKQVVKTNAGGPPNVTGVVKLSVIVPFYNVQQYAPDTLKSLGANAREDFEFILVDDCSRDETPDILARAERELPGAVYVRHEKNGGLATARNTGIDEARGEYLTFLDGDDWLAPATTPNCSAPSRTWAATSCARTMSSAPRGPARSTACPTGAGAW